MISYCSTKNHTKLFSSYECLKMGLAPDGGLFVPSSYPQVDLEIFSQITSFTDFSYKLLYPFFADDYSEEEFKQVVDSSLNFEIPYKKINEDSGFLELFHGPTAAFKDVGARFLASLFEVKGEEIVILVATSGDTGGAVASAFDGKKNAKVAILFPNSGVSPLQEMQLTCWGDNILSLKVEGVFDDCQAAVKHLITSYKEQERFNITSANSISIGRLLPQATYYAYHSLLYYKEHGVAPNFIVPTGNMGNVMACIYAYKWGFPIGDIYAVTNSNDVVPEYFNTHEYLPMKSIKTFANAMDVGNPSNFERYNEVELIDSEIFSKVKSFAVSDEHILEGIQVARKDLGIEICPHTATAYYIYKKHKIDNAIVVATAHPAKFQEVLHLVNIDNIKVPDSLSELKNKKTSVVEVFYDIAKIEIEINDFLENN